MADVERRIAAEIERKIAAEAERQTGASVEFLAGLVRAQKAGEDAVQARVAEAARAMGCAVDSVRYRPAGVEMVEEFASQGAMAGEERTNVVARFKGLGGGRSLIFFAHPDGEPVKGIERWRRDPFAAAIEGGRMYGWGVADDLAGVAMAIEGLRVALAAGVKPKGDVILASTPSKRHARGVSALLHGGLKADAAVYLHPAESGAGMREIKAFASGQLEFRVIVEGRPPDTTEPSHTAFAHRAVNPLEKAMVVLAALKALDTRRAARIRHPALEAAIGRSTNLLVSMAACGRDDKFSRVAERCTLGGALSFPPPERLSAVQAEIEAAVAEAAKSDEWLRAHPPRVEWVAGTSGAEVSADHPLYRAVAASVSAVTGEAPYVNPLHTASDIRNPIVQKGIPTVGLGPLGGDLSQNGRADEWVDVADYNRGVRVTAAVIASWCGA